MSVFLAGCYHVSQYSGDGTFVDKGSFAATDRYTLDLGPVNLVREGIEVFSMHNLPRDDFVVGFMINGPQSHSAEDETSLDPFVKVELFDSKGLIFSATGYLNDWTWSETNLGDSSFVYKRGDPGSYFYSVSEETYRLSVEVVESASKPMRYGSRLVVKSGGWK